VLSPRHEQILGIRFFNGNVAEAVEQVSRNGGLVAAPGAPSLVNLRYDPDYRSAVSAADLAIADSGFMVLLWRLITRRRVTRISGFTYVKTLLQHPTLRKASACIWVLPTESARQKTQDFLQRSGIPASSENFYVAPKYAKPVEDRALLEIVRQRRPAHVVIAVGGGTQDKLGLFLKTNAGYLPAIHCIGAALGFLTGDQIAIPDWADRIYLGWLFRIIAEPRIFIPRLSSALALPWMIFKYREKPPPFRARSQRSADRGQ
jgi:UDP-N-acetyl-D-mannosaminuronic acid transferase (WecB/TagA/CpsF family)